MSNAPELMGLDERLDRLRVSDERGQHFILSTKSAQNIAAIAREWLRVERVRNLATDLPEAEIATARSLARAKPSTSYLQRKMEIPYSRASRLMALLEAEGTVSARNAGMRSVLR